MAQRVSKQYLQSSAQTWLKLPNGRKNYPDFCSLCRTCRELRHWEAVTSFPGIEPALFKRSWDWCPITRYSRHQRVSTDSEQKTLHEFRVLVLIVSSRNMKKVSFILVLLLIALSFGGKKNKKPSSGGSGLKDWLLGLRRPKTTARTTTVKPTAPQVSCNLEAHSFCG